MYIGIGRIGVGGIDWFDIGMPHFLIVDFGVGQFLADCFDFVDGVGLGEDYLVGG
jgi:hypothetical protein